MMFSWMMREGRVSGDGIFYLYNLIFLFIRSIKRSINVRYVSFIISLHVEEIHDDDDEGCVVHRNQVHVFGFKESTNHSKKFVTVFSESFEYEFQFRSDVVR